MMASSTSFRNATLVRDLQVKLAIKKKINEAVKSIQTQFKPDSHQPLVNCDLTHNLCYVLESMFLHGTVVKHHSLVANLWRKNVDANFLHFVMIFSHRDDLHKMENLSQIKTDIGKCRVWLRMTLNNGSFISLLESMIADREAIKASYEKNAFMRDQECLEIAHRYLLGLEVFKFDLVLNSSLLNSWQTASLAMAGLWVPKDIAKYKETHPSVSEEQSEVVEGVDALTELGEEADEQKVLRSTFASFPSQSHHSNLNYGIINDDEIVRLLLKASASRRSSSSSTPNPGSIPIPKEDYGVSNESEKLTEDDDEMNASVEESYDPHFIYKAQDSTEEDIAESMKVEEERPSYINQIIDNLESDLLANSLSTTPKQPIDIKDSEEGDKKAAPSKVPCLSGFIDSWRPFSNARYFDSPPQDVDSKEISFQNSNIQKPDISIGPLNVQTTQTMLKHFDEFSTERGLDNQEYQCADCLRAIGSIFGPAKLCNFTKNYYCQECHKDERSLIPVQVVYNWNFSQLVVSSKAKIFLNVICNEPVIDSRDFGENFFEFAPEMEEAISLRKKLYYMMAYLATCSQKGTFSILEIEMNLGIKSYLAQESGKFSICDLEGIKNGTLVTTLKKCVSIGEQHILPCILCSGKGFICEVCKDASPIYPFNLELISQCQKCYTVFHLDCSLKLATCPKCDRLEARNLNWHINNCKIERSLQKLDV